VKAIIYFYSFYRLMQLDSFQSHQSPWADLPGTVAALPSQVLAVGQDAWGPSALERKPGVDEGGSTAGMVHKERLHVYTEHEAIKCPFSSGNGKKSILTHLEHIPNHIVHLFNNICKKTLKAAGQRRQQRV